MYAGITQSRKQASLQVVSALIVGMTRACLPLLQGASCALTRNSAPPFTGSMWVLQGIRDLIWRCLQPDRQLRPTAKALQQSLSLVTDLAACLHEARTAS